MKSKDDSNTTNFSFPYPCAQLSIQAHTHMHHIHAIMCTTHIIQTIHIMHIHVKGAKLKIKGKSCILLLMLWFRRAILVWDFWTYMQINCNLALKEVPAPMHSLKHYSRMWNNLYIVECWMNKSYSIHTLAIEYYSFFKNKETIVFKIIWMNIEDNKPR